MTDPPHRPLRYADAGVDIAAADATVRRYADVARRSTRPEVLSAVGGFAGLFRLGDRFRDPVLVAATDGVGTKVLLQATLGRFETAGRDVVNNNVNDLITVGAEPLFFLDYLATADLPQERRVEIVEGIGAACRENGIALLGGETADMPDLYRSGDFDLAGFVVGVTERDAVIDGSRLAPGDALIALPSGGLQTNGFSLVREIWGLGKGLGEEHDREVLNTTFEELGGTLGDALVAPHRSFYPALRELLPRIHGIAHITGGGIPGNLPRILPDTLAAAIDRASWELPAVFELIRRTGSIEESEMFSTFNMGAGMILAVAEADASDVLEALPEGAWRVGEVVARGDGSAIRGLPA
ncbi:MAG: phosphoribosylformylglycinamidine cyclo-ligase [Chloroflexi bacterium]|nr:phosphoribosylformylglycinamidine cyclo-ligase [Chloroflexota bacterium]MDA1002638.1 phosphoribosylformylglycinamidine cyclo-ligase [Chloroflexota bacterium]MQC27539.1 phosphoribosylformylglycinamidine cyclo-ligase [Chloroflexota bacterium]